MLVLHVVALCMSFPGLPHKHPIIEADMLQDVEFSSPLAEVDLCWSTLVINGKFFVAETALIELKLEIQA